MPMYKFRDCLASEVETMEHISGSFLVCRDTGDIIYDALDGVTRVPLSKAAHKVEGLVKDELFPQDGHLYYSTSDKMVCMYHNGNYQPINMSIIIRPFNDLEIDSAGSLELTMSSIAGIDSYLGCAVLDTTIDSSIKDLESQFSIGNSVSLTGENPVITLTNSNESYAWLGSATVMAAVITNYYEG